VYRQVSLQTSLPSASSSFCPCSSNDGRFLASGGSNGILRLWEYATGAMVAHATAHSGFVTDITFSLDDRQVIATGQDGAISIWCIFTE
jgi:WD40 repeat protein